MREPIRVARSGMLGSLSALCAALIYPLFLIVSAIFVVPLTLLTQTIAGRAPETSSLRMRVQHRTRWFVFIDLLSTALAYLVADFFRCRWWMQVSWPEVVHGYGNTIGMHLTMLAILVPAWPIILYWLGWYRPRHRPWGWRVKNTLVAGGVLGLLMCAIALGGFREIYPRAQIGFTILILPLMTGLIRSAVEMYERGRRSAARSSRLDPAW
ncbi:MAG TPA: hypothetical protein VNT79_16310 [Phycisphaerae bacterium]|nr:hypothetical protein [Phycisphaerae bacterium]